MVAFDVAGTTLNDDGVVIAAFIEMRCAREVTTRVNMGTSRLKMR